MVLQLSIRTILCPGFPSSFVIHVNKEYENVTYLDIKNTIFNIYGLPINHQCLILCGNVKEDNGLVSEDDIVKHACLHLVGTNIEKN